MLTADEVDMARWKGDAERAGVKFSEHVRTALDVQSGMVRLAESAKPVKGEARECSRSWFHRAGTFCKECGKTV